MGESMSKAAAMQGHIGTVDIMVPHDQAPQSTANPGWLSGFLPKMKMAKRPPIRLESWHLAVSPQAITFSDSSRQNVRLYPRAGVSSVLVQDTDAHYTKEHPLIYTGCGLLGGIVCGGVTAAATDKPEPTIGAGVLGAVVGAGVGYALFHEKVDTHRDSNNRRGSRVIMETAKDTPIFMCSDNVA